MLARNVVGILAGMLLPLNTALGAAWPHSEIRGVGKNLIAMAGFYATCSQKEYVDSNRAAVRWAIFMGTKYLVIGGIEAELQAWINKGENGIVISDPTKSETTMEVEFSESTCSIVKNLLDSNYKLVETNVVDISK